MPHMYIDTHVYMHVHVNRRGSDQIPGPKGWNSFSYKFNNYKWFLPYFFFASVIQSSVIVTSKGHFSPWKQNRNNTSQSKWQVESHNVQHLHKPKDQAFDCTSRRFLSSQKQGWDLHSKTINPTGTGKVKTKHFQLFLRTLSCFAI